MAAIAATAVSLYPTVASGGLSFSEWQFGGQVDKRVLARHLALVLTGQGGASNTIGASALGFSTLVGCSNLIDAQNSKLYQAAVDPVNNVILLSAVAADTYADITASTAYITVWGIPKVSPAA